MIKIQLNFPLKHGEEEISELDFRRPTYKEVQKYKISDIDKFSTTVELTAKLTGYPEAIFNSLDLSDLMRCVKVITDFLSSSPEIQGNALSS